MTTIAAIAYISPDDARALSLSLFRAMETLAHADAHLHSVHFAAGEGEAETEITTTLFRATQVAHSSCESALARVEPFYDTHTAGTVAADSASCFCSCSCRSLVSSTLKNADTVVSALEHASNHLSTIVSLPLSVFCGDEAMRAAIDAGDLGAISLAVVLLLELPSLAPPLQLVHHALSLRQKNTETTCIVCVLLTVPAIAASACNADEKGNTALMIASVNGHTEFVNALLACPTVVQSAGAVDITGKTELMIASENGNNTQILTVNDTNNNTALMLASKNGHTETVRTLLACPTVVQSAGDVNTNGYTALMLASLNGYTETVVALLACPTVVQTASAVNEYGFTALILSSATGNAETVAALLVCPTIVLSAGVSTNYGLTALMFASTNGHAETVAALLACPTVAQSASAINTNGDTALILASYQGHTETVAALLECPVVVQSAGAVNTNGNTALMLAQLTNKDDALITLLLCVQH
jgi:ankyrin repeat protein